MFDHKHGAQIDCSVNQCKHNDSKNHCTLSCIQVGTHETNPTGPQCTDCQSFALS